MVDIALTSTGGSGYLETDFDQIKDLLQDGGVEPTSSSPLSTKAGTETLTNKTINTASNTITIVEADISDLSDYVDSDPTGVTGADIVTNMMSLTQAEYDAIGSPDASTFYIITD